MAKEYPGVEVEDADPGRQALPGDPAVGGRGEADAADRRAPRRPPHRRHRHGLAGREPRAARALQPAAGRHDRHPARGHPLDRGGRQGRPAVGARGRGADPARAAVRAGHRPPRGRGVRDGAHERRGGDRHQQVARRGDRRSSCRRTCSSSWASARPRSWRSPRSRPRSSSRPTKVEGHDEDPVPAVAEVATKCPITGRVGGRPRVATDPIVWTEESWDRLKAVPLIARPLARNTVERFARNHGIWRITTTVDGREQAGDDRGRRVRHRDR